MNRDVQRYTFKATVPADEIESTVLLSILATEGLHGQSRVLHEAAYYFDADTRVCVIDCSTEVGRDVCRIFGGFAIREFGEGSFTVHRPNGVPEAAKEELPA